MALSAGTRIGHYDVVALLGEGGMGQVWQATDTQLGREVALKILPDAFAADPDRLARFKREAQILASLNHPNIAAIYGIEEDDGTRALVLELVEGPTLADRIAQGPIPLDEALPIAKQIAEALEAAHEAGVIHRDLKPANIKVRDDGTVKVLDFGLAKAFQPDANDASASMSPTISLTAAGTQMGMVIGTAAYMSPEQAKGKAVDKRADVWAFGAVLFEMLTRRKAFPGDDVSDTLATVLKFDPDWDILPADTPASVRRLLRRCLVKDPKLRLREEGSAIIEIDEEGTTPGNERALPASAPRLRAWQRPLPAAVAMLASLGLGGFAAWSLSRPAPPRVVRFQIPLAADQRFTFTLNTLVAISPENSRVVYTANGSLWLRSIDQVQTVQVRGTDVQPREPFFSADGQSIGFWTDGQLKRVSVSGGAPVTLTDAEPPSGASWGPDDTIVYGQSDGIWRISANGGTPVRIVATEENQQVSGPQVLAGGASVLFTLARGTGANRWDEAQIIVQSLESAERTVLIEGGAAARYVRTGHLVYAVGNVLYAVAFDADSLTVSGGSVPMVEGVRRATDPGVSSGTANFSISEQGGLVYVSGGLASSDRTLALVGRNGEVEPVDVPPAQYLTPRVSPDGRKLVVQTAEDEGNVLWVYDLSGDTQIQQLTFEGDNQRPVWTPDSQRITFSSDRDGTMSLYWMPADGSGIPERLTTAEAGTFHWAGGWSPDGQILLFNVQRDLTTDWDIWTLLGPDRETRSLYDAPNTIYLGAELSPNGEWLAYGAGSNSVTMDVYVEPFPPTGSRRRVSQSGGYWPLWSPDGDRLFYRPISTTAGLTLRSVDVVAEPGFAFSNERTLPIDGFIVVAFHRDYDITPDGERFIMVFPADQTEADESSRFQINVVLNWTQELLERVPVP